MDILNIFSYTFLLSVPILSYVCYSHRLQFLQRACVHYVQVKRVCCPKRKNHNLVIDITETTTDVAHMTLLPHIERIQYTYIEDVHFLTKKKIEEQIYYTLRDCKISYNKNNEKASTKLATKVNIYNLVYQHIKPPHEFPESIHITLNVSLIELLHKFIPIQHMNEVIQLNRKLEHTIHLHR